MESQDWTRGYLAGQQDAIAIERRAAQHGCVDPFADTPHPCEQCVGGADAQQPGDTARREGA